MSSMVPVGRRNEELLTSREVLELLKIGRGKLARMTKSRKIPAYRVGDRPTARLRYKRSEVLAWLDSHRAHEPELQADQAESEPLRLPRIPS